MYLDGCLLSHLLFEYVHRRLVRLELLVLEEDPPSQLQRRRQVRVVAEVAFKEEARHEAFPEHRLKHTDQKKCFYGYNTLQIIKKKGPW